MKYYAVKVGEKPGVYTDWELCKAQVEGYKGAQYKSFKSMEEAAAFVAGDKIDEQQAQPAVSLSVNTAPLHVDVFVDGSYNATTGDYGYGILMSDGVNKQIYYGKGKMMDGGRNVEGEVEASRIALQKISAENKYSSITIYHDYEGIGMWADKKWKANKGYTNSYQKFVQEIRDCGFTVNFVHVDGHTGVDGNEYVDKLAKVGCDLELKGSEKAFLRRLSDLPGFPEEAVKNMRIPDMINYDENVETTPDVSPKY